MVVDGTLLGDLSMKRNVPVRYSRENVRKTVEAMRRVEEIRSRRERRFYKERMRGNKLRALEADRKLVRENQHLLPPEERERVERVLGEMEGEVEEMSGLESEEEVPLDESEIALQKEESLLQDIAKEEKVKKTPMAKKVKGKGRRVIVGHGPEKMDVD